MITEQIVRTLIEQKGESRNLDYKLTTDWSGPKDPKLELTKDLLAMANTQDGGRVIFGVDNSTYNFVGMPEEDWQSLDHTPLNEFVQKYGGPSFRCDVQKWTIDGKCAVSIDVPEFEREIVICIRDANSSFDQNKLILAKGAIYVRTAKASSEAIRSDEDMRNLLNRALLKKGDDLLRNIEQLIKGKPPNPDDESHAKYTGELNQAFDQFLNQVRGTFKDAGYWQVMVYPTTYKPQRIVEIPRISEHIRASEVSLRGWIFPHTDRQGTMNFSEGIQSSVEWQRYREGYRAYRSGLFVWVGALWEDILVHRTNDDRRILEFPCVIYDVTEFLLFCRRYFERLDVDSLSFRLYLNGTQDRVLMVRTSDHETVQTNYICHEPAVTYSEIIPLAELKASYDVIARRILRYILALFNWNDPSDDVIHTSQRNLVERRL